MNSKFVDLVERLLDGSTNDLTTNIETAEMMVDTMVESVKGKMGNPRSTREELILSATGANYNFLDARQLSVLLAVAFVKLSEKE